MAHPGSPRRAGRHVGSPRAAAAAPRGQPAVVRGHVLGRLDGGARAKLPPLHVHLPEHQRRAPQRALCRDDQGTRLIQPKPLLVRRGRSNSPPSPSLFPVRKVLAASQVPRLFLLLQLPFAQGVPPTAHGQPDRVGHARAAIPHLGHRGGGHRAALLPGDQARHRARRARRRAQGKGDVPRDEHDDPGWEDHLRHRQQQPRCQPDPALAPWHARALRRGPRCHRRRAHVGVAAVRPRDRRADHVLL